MPEPSASARQSLWGGGAGREKRLGFGSEEAFIPFRLRLLASFGPLQMCPDFGLNQCWRAGTFPQFCKRIRPCGWAAVSVTDQAQEKTNKKSITEATHFDANRRTLGYYSSGQDRQARRVTHRPLNFHLDLGPPGLINIHNGTPLSPVGRTRSELFSHGRSRRRVQQDKQDSLAAPQEAAAPLYTLGDGGPERLSEFQKSFLGPAHYPLIPAPQYAGAGLASSALVAA